MRSKSVREELRNQSKIALETENATSQMPREAAPEPAQPLVVISQLTGGFLKYYLRPGNTRRGKRPARSQQPLQERLMKPGCCHSNGEHTHSYRRSP